MKIYVITTQDRFHLQNHTEQYWRQVGENVQYYDNTNQHPGKGRNAVLQKFYNECDDEWCVISDDDNIIDPKRGYYELFIEHIDQVLDSAKKNDIATFGILNNIVHRVATTINHPVIQSNWVWMRSFSLSNIFFHRRTKFVPFNETEMLEDQEWCMDQLTNGLKCATLMNLVMKDINLKSCLFKDNEHRMTYYKKAKQNWLKKYTDLKPDKNGRISKLPLIKRYWTYNANWGSIKNIGVACRNKYQNK